MLNIDLYIYSKSTHISAVITGFLMLARQKQINLTIYKTYNKNFINDAFVEAVVNNKIKIAYDLLDGYNINADEFDQYLDNIDYCFKRSFSSELNSGLRNKEKIYPLGFSYHVSTRHNPIDAPDDFKKFVKTAVKYCLKMDNSQFTPYVIEKTPDFTLTNTPRILFSTRLWAPMGDIGEVSSVSEKEALHRNFINDMRINIIKNLKNNFGSNFTGGVYNSPYAKERCPDLIIDRSVTSRKNYINLMKNHDICIGSTGLHNSTGWKTGEYIAAARAIVNEDLCYEVPGNFEKGVNYLSFSNEQECIDNINYLIKNPDIILKMQWNNYIYYNTFLRPDLLIYNTLLKILKLFF